MGKRLNELAIPLSLVAVVTSLVAALGSENHWVQGLMFGLAAVNAILALGNFVLLAADTNRIVRLEIRPPASEDPA